MMHIILRILYTVIVLGLLVTVHELGHFIAARKSGIHVLEFAIGMGPAICKIKGTETLFSLRIFPLGGYCRMEGEDEDNSDPGSFGGAKVWKRIITVAAGAIMNLFIAFLITFFLVIFTDSAFSTTVAGFQENNVSHETGLEIGDKIIRVDGKKINISTDISVAFSRTYGKKNVEVIVKREGQEVTLSDIEFPVVEVSEGIMSMVPDFFVTAEQKTVFSVLRNTVFETASYVTMMYESLYDMLSGRVSLKYVSGPVGTSEVIAEAASVGFSSLASLVAMISINLCVINLLPLPALDGGRLVFLFIEWIFKKPVNKTIEGYIHFAGMMLLIILFVLITFKDIFFPVY